MILNLKSLSLIEDASPDNIVTLTNINEGVDGSSVFGITNEHEGLIISAGETYINSANPVIDVRVLKPSSADITQIESWIDNQTELSVCGLTIDGFIMFGNKLSGLGKVKIVANEQLSDSDVFAFKITKKTTVGFSPDSGIYQGGFWAGTNGLGMYDFVDNTGNGVADNWTTQNFSSTFTTAQNLTVVGASSNKFQTRIWFPYGNTDVTYSLSIDSINEYGGDYAPNINILFYDSSDSNRDSAQQTISSTGVVSITATSHPDTAWIQVDFRAQELVAGSQSADFTISKPSLRIDGSTVYTKF